MKNYLVLGTYTRRDAPAVTASQALGEGIYIYEYDPESGVPGRRVCLEKTVNPSYLEVLGERLFAVNEIKENAVLAEYRIMQENGSICGLKKMSETVLPGADSCHITVDEKLGRLILSNYSSGSIYVFQVEDVGKPAVLQGITFEGKGPDKARQEQAHAHSSLVLDDLMYVADLGSDKVRIFSYGSEKVREKDTLAARAGAGPRHMEFFDAKEGRVLYVVNELDCTVAVMRDGKEIQTVMLWGEEGPGADAAAADIHRGWDGFLYVSVRGINTIFVFEMDGKSGLLRAVQKADTVGAGPRSFCLDQEQKHLIIANQITGNLTIYDRREGYLHNPRTFETPLPVKVLTLTL